jgi:RHH-type proline utilization regulon transcriptional repressor/proline dehydrogenase/delta 1-pyrroline-5-carboxylate dehydrogenase
MLTIERLLAAANETATDAEAAVAVARLLIQRAHELQTPQERRQQAELNRMISHPQDKATLVEMTDQAFRTTLNRRTADQLTHILDVQGIPRFFSGLDRTMLRGFQSFGGYVPGVAVPLVKEKMRRETANVILPAEPDLLTPHLRERYAEGLRMNVNFLGEALLGEQEATRRLNGYLAALQQPEVECISVKISTIYSQISPLARKHTLSLLANRLELLFRAAAKECFIDQTGKQTSKFVYLDMEEYRDMYLTRDALIAALSRPGLEDVRAGIALQAYIPDSYGVLCELAKWSRQRLAKAHNQHDACEPLTVRVVKGANMEMERVEASLMGWPQATYQTKEETDANFKRMVREALQDENAESLRIGIASHNLFDVSLALIWAARCGGLGTSRVQFEMLEGMANHQRRAIFECVKEFLLYAPACRQQDFIHAIGYLIRRLDENTGAENFLRHAFHLDPLGDEFASLAHGFRQAASKMDSISAQPRRTQDRRQPAIQPPQAADWSAYINEPDTDWSLPHHADWAAEIVARWEPRCNDLAPAIPLWIAGEERTGQRAIHLSYDPSRPGTISCRYHEATETDIEDAVACGKADPAGWRSRSHSERQGALRQAAHLMRQRRGDLIGAAIADGGKTIHEADPEVSEAIDFTEFYALAAAALYESNQFRVRGRGLVAVISPWNFPLAIPCGGVTAALAAGNTVILKPASDTVLPAWMICKCLWDAGVPREALQLIPCQGSTSGQRLVTHDDVDVVIFTGGTETAQQMLTAKPTLNLLAETGGKNATIVTALADRDQAIKHVLHSSFSHAGQKCSATSLLLLEEEVYDDPAFRQVLTDAVQSLHVGSAWDLSTKVGPLIRPPTGVLLRGLKELEHGEEWLVMSEQVTDNPCLYRPCIKWNVQPESFTHTTELFGPVLGVMKFKRLEEAINLVNRTGYGLTSGLESLDDREQAIWQTTIRAGNLYLNRPTTGAIVLRQPFGGIGKSSWGPGLKAGGPHYLVSLVDREELPVTDRQNAADHAISPAPRHSDTTGLIEQLIQNLEQSDRNFSDARLCLQRFCKTGWNNFLSRLQYAATDYQYWANHEYLVEHDSVYLVGQDNFRRYRPVSHLRLRLDTTCSTDDILLATLAAVIVGCRPVLSFAPDTPTELFRAIEQLTRNWAGTIELVEETDSALAEEVRRGFVDRIRVPIQATLHPEIHDACTEAFVPVIAQPVTALGRFEPLWYLSEQSLSKDYHRYGNLGRRATELRRPVL